MDITYTPEGYVVYDDNVWLTAKQARQYLRVTRQRVYDIVKGHRAAQKRGKRLDWPSPTTIELDGFTRLWNKAFLDRYDENRKPYQTGYNRYTWEYLNGDDSTTTQTAVLCWTHWHATRQAPDFVGELERVSAPGEPCALCQEDDHAGA
jgi:hypothetical protein